jgi:hypothetical protein
MLNVQLPGNISRSFWKITKGMFIVGTSGAITGFFLKGTLLFNQLILNLSNDMCGNFDKGEFPIFSVDDRFSTIIFLSFSFIGSYAATSCLKTPGCTSYYHKSWKVKTT